VPVRKQRNRVLRELAASKNLEFRRRMLGRSLSAVTLHEPGIALTGNYLKIELSAWQPANIVVQCTIKGLSSTGLIEQDRPTA